VGKFRRRALDEAGHPDSAFIFDPIFKARVCEVPPIDSSTNSELSRAGIGKSLYLKLSIVFASDIITGNDYLSS
jgi:hypothetical protein